MFVGGDIEGETNGEGDGAVVVKDGGDETEEGFVGRSWVRRSREVGRRSGLAWPH